MKFIFPQILFACFVLALYFAIVVFRKREFKYMENRLFFVFCLSSAVWSLGFYGVIVQTVPDRAYAWRALGMIGTFAYLISVQFLVCYLSGMKKRFHTFSKAFSFLGVIIYFFTIQKEMVTHELSEFGMTYSFHSGIWNTLYITYCVVLAINLLIIVIDMIRNSPNRRIKELGKKCLLAEIIIVFGMIFDTIFPMISNMVIPGSSIAQFLGLIIFYHAIIFMSHSRITIGNMSEFIYYSLTVPVLVYDSKQQLQLLNDTAYSFLGVEKENLSNTDIKQLFTLKQSDIFDFSSKSREVDAVCCHNQLYCSLSVNKIHDAYGDTIGYIIIVTDLSERMKTMQELEEAMKDAEYANHAKSAFLANMSHEIRTPMNAIMGFSELVLKMDINNEVREHVEDIKWSSHNLLAIINDILDISKIESGKMELVLDRYATGDLLNDVALIISAQAEKKGLEFHMQVAEQMPKELYGDKVRIRGILINILNNAVKYTQKGLVSFDVSILNQTEDFVRLAFKISDTGIGIRQENLKNLFQNFERLDHKINYGIEGSGLGLAIANGYVTLMDGKIQVESTYGEGSVFTVILDQNIIDATPLEKDFFHKKKPLHSNNTSNMKIHGLEVLVTDDNLVNLRVAHGILSYYGLLADTASSGMEAIELCRSKNYDLIFMDQMMPGLDGTQTMNQIRDLNSHYSFGGNCKIIVLTADAIKGTRELLIDKGFDEYLGKPINTTELEQLFLRFISEERITYDTPDENSSENGRNTEHIGNAKNEKEILFLKEKLPEIKVENGILNCGGEIQDYLNILKITYEYGEKHLAELEYSWKQQDYENYIIKIHALKSTSLSIGATEISDFARKQEESGRSGDFAYIDQNMTTFQKDYRVLLNDLEKVLSHYQMLESITRADALPKLDETTLLPILNNMEHCIDEFDFGKVFEILEEMRKYSLPEKYKFLFTRIEELMETMSVEEIKELLHDT
ncbi:MAG: response regulator [Lachnospiraceae bacterium]|nr:response regulator [Lachnospiraceae bacterium]